MEEIKQELAVYVLVRTDLPSLNSGKGMAQVHHAGVQLVSKYGAQQLVRDYITQGIQQGADNFNTTLVLGATLDDIIRCAQEAENAGDDVVVFNTVTDPSYPFLVQNGEVADLIPETVAQAVKQMPDGKILMVRSEVTCAWFLGDRNSARFRVLFDGLDLHP